MTDAHEAKQATPHALLLAELLDSRIPKSEREHAAKREIERLTAERDDLRRQLAEAEMDAERYRWLRGDSCPDHSSRWTQWEVRCWKAPSWTGDLRRADLDDAIDAARGKE